MFSFDDKEIKEYAADLKAYAHRAYPFATKATLNKTAFHTQKIARRDVNVKFVLRNRWTVQSIQVHQVVGLNVNNQMSVVGSTLEYMEDQEFGETINKTGKIGKAIPTGFSAGQENNNVRTKLPKRSNKLRNIKLTRRGSRKQRTVAAVQIAVQTGNRHIYLDLGKTQGIFKVVGGSKRRQRGWPGKAKLKMVYDLSQDSVRIAPTPWLEPAHRHGAALMPKFALEAFEFQVKRMGLFRGS